MLRCFVVVWCYYQQSVCTQFFCFLRQLNGISSVIAAGTCNDRYTFVYFFNGKSNDFTVFLMWHGSRFACSATSDDCVSAVLNLEFNQFFQFCIVDRTVLVHRGNNSNTGSGENLFFHGKNLLSFGNINMIISRYVISIPGGIKINAQLCTLATLYHSRLICQQNE